MEHEIWKSIKGFEGAYEVSSHGRIRSLSRNEYFLNRWGREILRNRKATILSPCIGRGGYLLVSLSDVKNGITRKSFRVHRIVALAFIPNPLGKSQINHIDGNKRNNIVSNLEWCTHKENEAHATQNNLHPSKESHGRSKLTGQQVLEIRHKYAPRHYSLRRLAKEYNVGASTIRHIIKSNTWK